MRNETTKEVSLFSLGKKRCAPDAESGTSRVGSGHAAFTNLEQDHAILEIREPAQGWPSAR